MSCMNVGTHTYIITIYLSVYVMPVPISSSIHSFESCLICNKYKLYDLSTVIILIREGKWCSYIFVENVFSLPVFAGLVYWPLTSLLSPWRHLPAPAQRLC